MKPVPQPVLVGFILTLCALCAWQWHREKALREIIVSQASELATLQTTKLENDSRILAANAEILRLTGALSDLRANSIPLAEQQEIQSTNARLKETFEQQNAAIKTQNESLSQANTAIQQANETIKKLTTERDTLAKRLNETTARYNKLANP